MHRFLVFAAFALAFVSAGAAQSGRLRVATFRADATPPKGEPLIWTTPVEQVLDPLWAKGIVLDDGRNRYVLCAIDWCGLGGSIHSQFRAKMAAAAGTAISRVALQSLHQHTAPYADGDAYRLLETLRDPSLRPSRKFLDDVTDRLAAAVKQATGRLEPFDRIGTGEARVERVASERRIHGPDGKIIVRYSTSGKSPQMAAAPEGFVDPELKTITLAAGNKPLVRLHYYATHPQTFCCDGRVSADFVGAAREEVEKKDGTFQVYFTGCSGDVTVGKYNDGSPRAYEELKRNLEAGIEASVASTRFAPATALRWRTVGLKLPPKPVGTPAQELTKLSGDARYRHALTVAFARRKEPLPLSSLEIGKVHILHLPGEPMLEFQMFAQKSKPGDFVAVAGYGDISPGYICTDKAFSEGGYEPSASQGAVGSEAALKKAIRQLLGVER